MVSQAVKNLVDGKFALAGIELSQKNRCGVKIHDARFYDRILRKGSLGLGESYMAGWWDAEHLDEFFCEVLKADLQAVMKWSFQDIWSVSKYFLLNPQSKTRALEVGRKHYDIGNDLFAGMLDKRMVYSCAYWKNASDLDQAQENKLELVCQKLYLQPGMRVLDIGCGWGGFAQYAAEKYQVEVVGITISQQQLELAKVRCAGLPITLRFQDYRDVDEKFDRIVSIGQIEHVGAKNYRSYMEVVHRCLAQEGIFLLHTIGGNKTLNRCDPWIEKYIFPNGLIPSPGQLIQAVDGLFILEDWHNFGVDYDKTLMAWHSNFVRHWDVLKARYDQRFYRMWTYYLLSCAGAFRSRDLQLWQMIFVKKGIPGGYLSIR